ncbi:MAG: FAD-binding oxidoreductase [Chitinophagaceae bacterium]|nr:FAD-binding oxidoreductase [Chitinophagaceae bacterium]
MVVDYIIVGQGLAGTFLSWNLQRAGKKVWVIDQWQPRSASRIASGVINPITGRRMVRTWMIETLMPFAVDAYTKFGHELGASLVRQCNIIDFHPTPQMKLAFLERAPEEKEFLKLPVDENSWREYFEYDFGYGETDPCWLVDINTMLKNWRQQLEYTQSLSPTIFNWADCSISPQEIRYQDIKAGKIFFCEGAAGADNPYFKMLPYARNKGEALIAEIPGLPRTHIFKQGINIVPWQDGLFWIGSSFEWEFKDLLPSESFRKKTEQHLSRWLKLPCRVLDHFAGERPANMERRPFAGLHPVMPSVGILNGMGTKGCTLAPYFANQLAEHVLQGTAIEPLADVKRFTRVLSR